MGEDDWDLYAVVRSCRISGPPAASETRDPFSSFLMAVEPIAGSEEGRFPDLITAPAAVPELEELCRPFFSRTQQQQQNLLLSPHQSSSSSLPFSPTSALPAAPPQRQRQPHRPLSQISRSKRRKNQQKRVVCHVPADGASADKWAWRKYGQKPIKGSPYPRGYYRCSSSKGCPARKQVERSRTDPGTLLLTYTAEHNHPVPTHRNSLAGSTRNKFPTTAAAASGSSEGCQPPPDNPPSSPLSTSTAAGLSPTTPLTASMEEELFRSHGEDEEDDEGTLLVEDMEVMGEDDLLFMGVDEVGVTTGAAATSSAFFDDDAGLDDVLFAPPWLANNKDNAAAAAGGG